MMPNIAHTERFNPFSKGRTIERSRGSEHTVDLISPAQVRAARGMLDWSMIDLAKAASVSVSTVKRFEDVAAVPVSSGTVAMMQSALEIEGITFLSDEGNGPGVRWQKR